MNWPSARSMRASGPRRTVNRAPASLAAVAKSIIPSASPRSKCCFGAKSKSRGSPTRFSTTLAVSSGPSGTDGVQDVRQRSPGCAGSPRPVRGARFSSPSISARSAVASASSAAVSAPVRLPWPISFASALRRACFSCSAVCAARRSASSASDLRRHRRQSAPRHARRRTRPDRLGWRGCRASAQTSTGFGSTQRARDDGDFVQRDQRQRQPGLGDDVRRRQDRGDDEHADIGVAAELLELRRTGDADLGQQRQRDRQLEGDAEGEDQLHHQVEVFADPRQQLDRHAAAAGRVLEAGEEPPGEREHEVIRQRRAEQEQDRRGREERQQRALLAAIQARCDEQPDLRGDDREGDEGAAEERHLDLGEERLVELGIDQMRVGIALLAQHVGQRFGQEVVDLAGEVIGDARSRSGTRRRTRSAAGAARSDDRAAASACR